MGFAIAVGITSAGAAGQSTEELYSEACDGGDLTACNVFGLMLERGERVPRDLGRAAELYQRVCEGGELIGCTNVALLHVAGTGVPADTGRAVGLFRVACEGGEELGCELLRAVQDAVVSDPTERHDEVGRVGDAVTGEPLADVLVEIVGRGTQSVSDATGHVRLAALPVGAYRAKVQRLGYEDLEGVFEVPGDERFFVVMT